MISSLYIMPTLSCNCSCTYCYIPHNNKSENLKNSFFKRITENFILNFKNSDDDNYPQLRFIGGEPYLKFELMLELLKKFYNELPGALMVINTNGTLIDNKKINSLQPYKKNLVHIISLDGIEEIHNSRRIMKCRSNSFKKAIESIKLLQNNNFRVHINMVLDKTTIPGFEEFLIFITKELKLDNLSVSLCQSDLFPMSREEKFELLEEVYNLGKIYNIKIGGHHRLMVGNKIPGLKCKAGQKSILVTPEGSLSACQRFVGKIAEKKIINNSIDFETVNSDYSIDDYCYTKDSQWLGEKLYSFYQKRFPEYLDVNDLDRILFGVI